jgi:peptidoglycan/LPS O-acetylase OafA/YrhL
MMTMLAAYLAGFHLPTVMKYPAPIPRSMLYDFFLHVTMLHGLSPTFDLAGGNNVFWSLAREEYLYLMYFALMFGRRRWGLWPSVAGVLALGVGLNFGFAASATWAEFVARSAIVLWFQWTLGMVAAEAHFGLVRLPRWCSAGAAVVAWSATAIACEWCFKPLMPFVGGMAFFTLLNYVLKLEREGRWKTNWFTGWMQRVGIISYSLYLVHQPIRSVLKQALRPVSYTQNPFLYVIVCTALAVGGYFGGKIFFRAVEFRFLNSSREQASRREQRVLEAA